MARPLSANTIYARKHGISKRLVKLVGGAEKLQALSPEVQALLIKPNYGLSRKVRVGGLAKRGMKRAPDVRTQVS